MWRGILVIATLASLQARGVAQSFEPVRAFAFDRGLVDTAEPYAPAGNPALLSQRQDFRFYAEWQRTSIHSYLMSFSYPLSARMGLGLSWHSLRQQDLRLLPTAAFNTSFTQQTFLISMGARGRTQWGQQIEVRLAANRALLLTGPGETPPPFYDDQRVQLSYRIGSYRELTKKLSFGIITPPIFTYAYRTFLDAPRPAQTVIAFGKEPGTHVWMPRMALQWKPSEALALAISNRSLEGETDAQAATSIRFLKNFNMTAAFAKASGRDQSKAVFGIGGYVKGFDAFVAYEQRTQELRVAVSFAPERAKQLIEVREMAPSAPVLYPYRLRHHAPAWLTEIELTNKTSKAVEISVKLSGPALPSIKKGITLEGDGNLSLDVPMLPAIQKLPAGAYEYNVEIVAYQRGRQVVQRQFAFEMKEAHDWSGDSSDLIYFIQPHDSAIVQTARAILSECAREQSVWRPVEVARCFYDFLRPAFRYVPDPRPLHARQDRVQYATETLQLKSGDCEDLTILMVSLLESVGIRSAFVEVVPPQQEQGHIFLLFDSQQRAAEVTKNDNLQRYVVRQNETAASHLFAPLELTRLGQPFEQAQRQALSIYQQYGIDQHGLAMGWVKIIDAGE